MSFFLGAKNFASWLKLCPNNVVTGGKIRKRKTKKVINRAAQALRISAQSLHKNASYLGSYYRRQVAKHGLAKAITNTAHKLACLIYRTLKYGQEYVDNGQEQAETEHKERQIKNLIKRFREVGYEIVELQTGEVVS